MPRQMKLRKVDSTEVQGEGSFVNIRPMRYGDSRSLREQARAIAPDDAEARVNLSDEVLRQYVHSWNWADEDGNPLPTPQEDPTVLERLTLEEINFLGRHVTPQA